MDDDIPFSRRVYSGRGVFLDNLLTEVAARPELLRLVRRAKDMSDEELATLVEVIGRSSGRPVRHRRWHPGRPLTLLAGAGALVVVVGLISVVLLVFGTARAAG
ncbi:MAG TPA: hypothetical protein VET82_01910 [Candidatus Eisenbacteria bacterium]|nr:hypothetical protein [Candidatus Eisenbacteria bacterium]